LAWFRAAPQCVALFLWVGRLLVMQRLSIFLPKRATQVRSKIASEVEQPGLMLTRAQPLTSLPMDSILARKSLLGAINLCIELSGLEDKEIYLPLGIDAGHFSNLRKGKGHFPIDKVGELMDLCRNEVPLIWQAHQRGYGLVVLKSEAERRAEVAERRAEEAEMKVRVLQEAIAGRTVAA
jgi:hypothetical protein